MKKLSAQEALQKYWGYGTFRPKQEEIINSVLDSRDTFALLPTGGGKSLCYQLPAVVKEGIALVISPLLSLMKDQVMQLQKKGIKALYIPGGTGYRELDTLLDNCIYGNYKLLYLSPERLQQELVLSRLKQMNLSLIAIDEAHCISQWGHDFRPSYRTISSFRESVPDVPCIALTATATKTVVKDIIEQLDLKDATLFQSSFERKNLAYIVLPEEDKFNRLEQILKRKTGSAIVYVRSRKTANSYAAFLNSKGISAHYYHGGLGNSERHEKFTDWITNKTQVMVATNAFGMGIDKPDVQTIIHVELPESIESYFQEAGRAGRDGNRAASVILYTPSDKDRLENQFLRVLPSVDFVRTVYKKLNSFFRISYGEGQDMTFRFDFMEFCKTYDLPSLITYNALQVLDRNSVLILSQEFYRKATLQFKVSAISLTHHLIKNPGMDEIVKSILRTYGGIFDQAFHIDHAAIAQKSGEPVHKVHQTLMLLEKDDIVTYDHTNYDSAITFTVPREDDLVINRIAGAIKAQNERKAAQVKAMLDYIKENEVCRSRQLLYYFDEPIKTPCGICDVCLSGKSVKTQRDTKTVQKEILTLLAGKPHSSRMLVAALPELPEDELVQILKILLERKQIVLTETNQYTLKK